MSNSSRRRDNTTQFAKMASGSFPVVRDRYLSANSWNAKHEAFDMFRANRGGQIDSLFLARAAFELAASAPNLALSDSLFLESLEHTNRAMKLASNNLVRTILAGMFSINLPLLSAVHIENRHPSADQIDKARRSGMKLLVDSNPTHALPKEGMNYSGASAELCALVLKQTFSVEELNGEGWTPLPSLLSDDCDSKKGSTYNNNWDLSVYTDGEVPTYRTQIKFGDITKDRTYHPDISVVNLKYDVTIGNEQYITIKRLITEFERGYTHGSDISFAERVEKRATKLIDHIDPPQLEE